MARIGVCIEPFFSDLPYAERIEKIAGLGFTSYEFWFHDKRYDGKRLIDEEKDFDRIADLNEKLGLTTTDFVFNHPDGGIVASLIDKRDHKRLIEGLGLIIPLAKKIGCTRLICASGNVVEGIGREEALENMTVALREAAWICGRQGITLLLEPFNTRIDHPDCFLDDPYACVEVLRRVGHPSAKMLFDVYHMQIMSGNVTGFIRENIRHIGHFHIAGVPGRHEPDAGELNYPFILRQIDAAGYMGYVGLEYWPTGGGEESLTSTLARLSV